MSGQTDKSSSTYEPANTVSLFRVARRAGVARSTASAALNDKPGVSAETRARVLAAAEELGFRPNAVARSLRRGHRPAVGIVIDPGVYELESRLSKAFSTRYLLAFVEELSEQGLPVFQVTLAKAAVLHDLPVAAVQVFSLDPELDLVELPVGTPLIHSSDAGGHRGPTVDAHHNIAAVQREVMEHLWSQGSRRPALITRQSHTRYDLDFIESYQQWCREKGIIPIIYGSQGDQVEMAELATQIVADGADGIFSLVAEAAALIDGLQRVGKSVPDDVLVLSLSEGAAEEFTDPPISVMSLCGARSGRLVAQTIEEGIRTGRWPSSLQLPHELVVRRSSVRV